MAMPFMMVPFVVIMVPVLPAGAVLGGACRLGPFARLHRNMGGMTSVDTMMGSMIMRERLRSRDAKDQSRQEGSGKRSKFSRRQTHESLVSSLASKPCTYSKVKRQRNRLTPT
jgi:hypothetical protein